MDLLVHPGIDQYIYEHTKPLPALFDELREVTYAKMKLPQMQVGRVEGQLLRMLVQLIQAKRILEIGTFTGFSALCMAHALSDSGELITCDIDPVATSIAQSFFDRSPHGNKIRIELGDALKTIKTLQAPFDFIFLDADKEHYVDYYEQVLPLLRTGGLLVADNTLWSGTVLSPTTESAKAIVQFNQRVTEDTRVENVLLSVRDGMMIVRKVT